MISPRPISRRRGRWRRRAGAACVGAGLALAIVSLVSARWWFGYCGRTRLVDFGDGAIYTRPVEKNDWGEPLYGWHGGVNTSWVNDEPRGWSWTWWSWGESDASFDKVYVYSVWPLSPLLMLLGAATAIPGWRAARRARRGLCPSCAYSRAGLDAAAPCPECGHTPAPA